MRLEELYLDGFGHFHQRIFSPDDDIKDLLVVAEDECLAALVEEDEGA